MHGISQFRTLPYSLRKKKKPEAIFFQPNFQMNPQHNIPTFKEGDFVMNESRAIAAYLANSRDKSGKLYPSDPKVRAVVDQRMYFDMGAFYKAFGETVVCTRMSLA